MLIILDFFILLWNNSLEGRIKRQAYKSNPKRKIKEKIQMNMQPFTPEGWDYENKEITKENINKLIDNKDVLQGVVSSCDENYNLHIKLGNGISGIIPRQEVEAINADENGNPNGNLCTGKVNKFVQFKVKEVEENTNTVILSRKEVQEEALSWVKNDLQEGQKLNGIVKNIKPYGAFIEIGGGIVGLAHIEDLSVARIKSPSERIKVGQKIDIMVKSIDRDQGRVNLSYKELLGTWEENAKKIEEGTRVKGIVRETEKNKNGIFIELMPNLVGMAEYVENLEYGQTVDVYVKKIIPEKKKIKLIVV
jgi:small subunit ribosomal protein S1